MVVTSNSNIPATILFLCSEMPKKYKQGVRPHVTAM